MLKNKKAFSLLEVLVALFVLSMVTLVYMNSSTIFLGTQKDIIQAERKDQLNDLILQDIMEYASQKNDQNGTITVDGDQMFNGATADIALKGFTNTPQEGDIFLVEGVRGRYVVDSVTGTGSNRTVSAKSNFPNVNVSNNTVVTFIAFSKAQLNCFDGLDLTQPAPDDLPNCSSLPDEVKDLHNHWRAQIDDEIGSSATLRSVEVTDGNLVKVTIGDGTTNSVLAKRINICIFDDSPNTVAFTFPGLNDPIETGIIEGPENPVAHYYNNGQAQRYPNLNNDNGSLVNMTVSCSRTSWSTCRQTYASSNTITVFLYRYTGNNSVRVRPSQCDNSEWAGQCDGARIDQNDLSLWFIFDEYNSSNSNDISNIGSPALAGENERGYILYEVRNLPTGARIVVFDDDSESCVGAIVGGTCTGRYKWGGAHDGLVIDLNTSNLATLEDIELEITGVPYGVNRWRVLRSDVADCQLASGETNSDHGAAWFREDPDDCWNYVEAATTTLAADINSSATSIQVADSSIFPSSGAVQIGSEYVTYTGNDTATNTLSGLTRGSRNSATLPNSINSTFTGEITLNTPGGSSGGHIQTGFWGGYARLGGSEVVKVDYDGSFQDFDNNRIKILERGQRGTSAENHSSGDTVRNYDMRPRNWPSGTRVWEGPTNSIPVVQAEDMGTNTFERVRIKRRVTLNLSATAVCT